MKREIIWRGFLGFPLGIALGYVITIILSAVFADGHYAFAKPELIQAMGSEINAVTLQAVLCGVMGAGFAMASVIWELERWSIAKQSGVYFAITAVLMLPIAYVTNWMQHTLAGFLSYFGLFAAIFLVVWLIQYLRWKAKIRRINQKVQPGRDGR